MAYIRTYDTTAKRKGQPLRRYEGVLVRTRPGCQRFAHTG
ncbi:hypothetical protein M2432_004971 [Mycobacterium sp. OTB74]|jgi:hypothetical protein|nr:hypothetical protein [Mycobacterium sp. OTB74]